MYKLSYQRIFIKNIQDFTGVNAIKVKCRCGGGELNKTLEDISSIIMEKTEMDKKNKDSDIQKEETKICPNHKSVFYLNYYCVDCFAYICKECQSLQTNEHHFHRIFPCEKLKKIIKNDIQKNLFVYFDSENFKVLCDNIEKKIQTEQLMFKQTININETDVNSLSEFREDYVKKYKEEIQNIIQIFKIIKLYYMNYYKDLENIKKK